MKIVETLPLDQLQFGMIVSEAVLDAGGRLLVPAGAEVSEAMINGLRRREVAVVKVDREIVEDAASQDAFRSRTMAQLDHLFRHAGQGGEVRSIYQAVFDFRLQQRL